MGFFSWKCAKSFIEVTSAYAGTPPWTQEIVVLLQDREPIEGFYDGYGRVTTDDCDEIRFYEEHLDLRGDDEEEPTIILKRFYRGEKYGDIPPSQYGQWQGYFLPENYEQMADMLAKKCEERMKKAGEIKHFVIIVKQLVPNDKLDEEDRWDVRPGKYEYLARNAEEALDIFHSTVPISCLENYDISVELRVKVDLKEAMDALPVSEHEARKKFVEDATKEYEEAQDREYTEEEKAYYEALMEAEAKDKEEYLTGTGEYADKEDHDE